MFAIYLLFLCSIKVLANPEPQPLLVTNTNSFVVSLHRQQFFEAKGEGNVFDDKHMKAEMPKVLAKYQHAADFFRGLNLNPQSKIGFNNVSSAAVINDVGSSGRAPIDNTTQGASPAILPVLETTTSAQMGLTDYVAGNTDVMYTGSIRIGTPPQNLVVDVDTGSSDLWIMSDCASCSAKTQFNKKASSTYAESKSDPFKVYYGTGYIAADRATDVVAVQGLSIHNQSFGAATKVTDDFGNYPMSGILGMAFSTIASSGETTFFENLLKRQQVSNQYFGVHLERLKVDGSEMCLGCMDLAKTTGPISWIPVISQTYWTIGLGGLAVDKQLVSVSGVYAAVDTGTTYIYLPGELTKKFYGLIPGAKQIPGEDYWTFPCSFTSTISFRFGSDSFPLSHADFNLGPVSRGSAECVGGIIGMEDGFPDNLAIIGDEFLKSWYSVYDYTNGVRVGFAPSINNKSR